jgi:myo-inositol 2-dehydrogenase / D-chiro-inositol 1-dehydrogenase
MTAKPRVAPSSANRRTFLFGVATATALRPAFARGAAPARRIKLGVIGCGGRGSWIAGLFKKHGGYEMHAVCDYFPDVADKAGDALGVDKSRRFSTLSGYKRLIESGIEAVALEVPPYFLPTHASAAVAAGLHVYMAKPISVDAPGALAVEAAGKLATSKKQCVFVDYQIPTDPANQAVVAKVNAGTIGRMAQVSTMGVGGGFSDPPMTANLESRLRGLVWVNDVAIGGDYVVNYDIHAIDAALWVIGRRPVAAAGGSRICRANPHGDGRDVCSVVFEYPDGLVHNHFGQALPNTVPGELSCRVHGTTGQALITYWDSAEVKGSKADMKTSIDNLYEAGAVRNIATFHKLVTDGDCTNTTVRRSVDGALATILARDAAARRVRLTMDELIRENKRLDLDLSGLKT